MCDDSSYLEGTGRKIRNLRPAQAKLAKLYLKKTIKNKRAESMAQVCWISTGMRLWVQIPIWGGIGEGVMQAKAELIFIHKLHS
jgi:hypothetical protein